YLYVKIFLSLLYVHNIIIFTIFLQLSTLSSPLTSKPTHPLPRFYSVQMNSINPTP
uniref:Uncharacterized protein n=1 Tax=Sus scrofa TaxID=9823 RepID=A0A8D1M933_PIG